MVFQGCKISAFFIRVTLSSSSSTSEIRGVVEEGLPSFFEEARIQSLISPISLSRALVNDSMRSREELQLYQSDCKYVIRS
jgi:hypothetical protein